jgi:hypothetical protein
LNSRTARTTASRSSWFNSSELCVLTCWV